jgi:beta-phosphoglucomutase-like phosphatase (HAD superfamily)
MAVEFGQTWTQDDPRAVMSVSTSTRADYMVEQLRLDLSGWFQVVVCTDDLPRGKPALDVYLEAARCLNVNPETCVCVEDSSIGILAGKAAGMKVIAVPDMRFDPNYEVIRKAEIVLGSLEEFSLELIEKIKRVYSSFV